MRTPRSDDRPSFIAVCHTFCSQYEKRKITNGMIFLFSLDEKNFGNETAAEDLSFWRLYLTVKSIPMLFGESFHLFDDLRITVDHVYLFIRVIFHVEQRIPDMVFPIFSRSAVHPGPHQ
jgi:hypothetical protein